MLVLLIGAFLFPSNAGLQEKPSEPFHDLSFDAACKKARQVGKIVMIDFFTTWCAPCKMLDQTTWKDEKVRAWLRDKTVALKLDAEKKTELAKRYRVRAYPTILLLKPDGEEIDRLIGYKKPADFLSDAKAGLAGKGSLVRAKEKFEAAGENDPMARSTYANELVHKGKHAEALEHYLWCFDHGVEHNLGYSGVRLSFLLNSIARLGRSHPPAIEALKERRETAASAVLSSSGSFNAVMDLTALNRTLGDASATLAVYDKLRKRGKGGAEINRLLLDSVIDLLLEAKRYDDVLVGTGDISQRVDRSIQRYQRETKFFANNEEVPEATRERMLKRSKERVAVDGGKCYEALLGTNNKDKAAAIASRLIKFDNSWRTFTVLIKHAVAAGHHATARGLVEQGLQSAPTADHTLIREAGEAIP